MARETIYLVQSFRSGRGDHLEADPPIRCGPSDAARRIAENLAPQKAGVVAFATSGDAEAGDYDDQPDIIFKAGHLPTAFEDA
jgi:hypothetical protein